LSQQMESVRPRIKWKEIVIALLVMALLALLVWLFRKPADPGRDIVFGELGRREGASNAVTNARTRTPLPPQSMAAGNEQSVTNAPLPANQPSQAPAVGDSTSSLSSNRSPVSTNTPSASFSSNQAASPSNSSSAPGVNPPAARASSGSTRKRPASVEDTYPAPPEPANKPSTTALLAASREAGRGPDNPSPARTADLLGNNGAPQRMFDPDTGSNVVFIIDNSMSMMGNGKSVLARQAVARTLELMNPNQRFYVLLFHTDGYEGMPSLRPMPATPENVRAMTNWLFNVGHRTGADPTKAVQRALGLAQLPDTVWLLSDSEIPDTIVDNIREANASANARVNTIAIYSRDGEPGLRRVADENRGVYRFIPPPNTNAP
jgi:von Willebrand factor type A domain